MGRHVTSPTFVGRGDQLRLLLEQVRSNGPRCALVSGEAGVGKTRLVGELVRRAEDDGAVCLTGRCVPAGDQVLPLAPLVSALHDLADLLDPDELAEVLGPARPELARVVPDLGEMRTEGDPPAPARLFELFLGTVSRLADRRPVICVFEDLHWADTSSRELFGFLARYTRARVVLVATYRADELHRRHPLRPFLAELRRAVQPEDIALTGLSAAEIAELLTALNDHRPDAETASEVHRLSGGNAFFAEELAATGTVSDSLRDLLLARAAPLDDRAFRLLCVAAAAGAVDGEGVVAKVAGIEADDADALLAEVAAAGLLVADRDRWRFRHELARDVFEAELRPGARATVHRALAASIEERAPDRAARISWHLSHAGDQAGALEWSVRAARDAERMGAMAEAHDAYERAIAAWDHVPDAAAKAGCRHADLLLAAADAASRANRPERPIDLTEQAIAELEDDPVAAGAAWTKLAGFRLFSRGRGRMDDAAERALKLIPAEPPTSERAWALARHGGVLAVLGRYVESLPVSRDARAAATACGDARSDLYAWHTVGMATACLGDARGLATMREALDAAIDAGSALNVGRGFWNLAGILCQYDRYDEAIDLAVEGKQRLADLGMGLREGFGLAWNHLRALSRAGRWTELDHELASLRDLVGADRVAEWDAAFGLPVATSLLRSGRVDEARDLTIGGSDKIEQWQDPDKEEERANRTIVRIELAMHDGSWGEVRPDVDAVLDRAVEHFPINVPALVSAAIGAEADGAARRVGARDDAALNDVDRWLGLAATAAERYAGTDFAARVACWTDQAQAERGRLTGEPDATAWERIADGWDERGLPYEAAYARLRAAEAGLLTTGTSASPERDLAATILARAHERADQLGAVRLLAQIETLARHARVSLDGEVDADDNAEQAVVPFGLTERELQVLGLLAGGCTNREIADELYISVKTASVHVSNILRKLPAANRVEAAAIAHRAGIAAQ